MNKSYVSGFFDADGYITIAKPNSNEEPTVTIGFTNCYLDILLNIQKCLEKDLDIKGTIKTKKAYKENHSVSYDLRFRGIKKGLLLSDYLESAHPKKRSRLDLIKDLNRYTPKNGQYTEEIKQKRNEIVQKMLLLK